MLAQKLPPYWMQDYPAGVSILHAFAMCYAAAYNPSTLTARSWLSLERAFSIDARGGVDRVVNDRPAFTWSMTNYGTWKHILVAVEGTTSPQQHASTLDRLNDAVQVDADLGRTNSNFHDYSLQIYALLAGGDGITPNIRDSSTRITFAGYSLGAAVADLLANKWAKNWPNTTVRLIKFASPKVADAYYYQSRPARIQAVSIHRLGDDMWTLPHAAVVRTDVGGFAAPTATSRFVVDPAAVSMNWNGENLGALPEDTVRRRLDFIMDAARSLVDPAFHFQHLGNYYRHMLNQYARSYGNTGEWHFNYLEFPNDNRWQRMWTPGQFFDPAWIGIDDPVMPDYNEWLYLEYIRQIENRPAPQPRAVVRPRLENVPPGYNVVPARPMMQQRRQRTNPIGS